MEHIHPSGSNGSPVNKSYRDESDQSSIVEEEARKKFEEELGKYRIQIEQMRDLSIRLFEKQLIYVSAGTIAASVFIMDRFLNGIQRGLSLVIISWVFLSAVIIVNLLSHFFASNFYNRTIGEIIDNKFNNEKADNRASKIERFNIASLILYFFGLTFFVIYVVENIKEFNEPDKKAQLIENNRSSTYKNGKEILNLGNQNFKVKNYARK